MSINHQLYLTLLRNEKSITNYDKTFAIFQQQLPAKKAGIMQLELPSSIEGLKEKNEYRWTVAIVCNKKDPSQNSYARAWIERVAATSELRANLSLTTDGVKQALAYTRAGIWYDGIALLNQERINHPEEKQAVEYFTSLLDQIGLNKLSTF